MYRTIDTATWIDPKVRGLPSDGKLLFVYLITNSHAHVSGIYYIPTILVAHETALDVSRVDTLWHTLSDAGLIERDDLSEVVWVKRMFERQGRGGKHDAAAGIQLSTLHNCPLVNNFLQFYGDRPIPYPYPIHDKSHQEQEKEQNQDKEQEKEQGKDQENKPNGEDETSLSNKETAPKALLRLQVVWNELPDVQPFQRITTKRITAFRQRSKNESWMNSVKAALQKVQDSDFCRGKNNRGWVANVDWFLRPDTVVNLIEGKYDNRNGHFNHDPDPRGTMDAAQRYLAACEEGYDAQE